MYKNILVSGSSGFIGSNLVIKLNSLGFNVITLDFAGNADYSFDISDYSKFKSIDDEIDVIFHLAGQSGGYRSLIEHELDLDWNAKGTLNICMFAKERSINKIIYTSSMAVYGEGDWLKETDELHPISNYGVSKLYGEICLKQFSQYDIDYTIFRVFNTYGTGQNLTNGRQGVVAVFVAQAIKGNIINVTGSLDRYRDLTYIDDTVNALVYGLKDHTSKQTYNICSKIKITIRELIDMVIYASGRTSNSFVVNNIGKHDGDQFGNTGNNYKLLCLGWKPNVNLSEGIMNFYKYAEGVL